MLVFTRNTGQSIIIDGKTKVTIQSVTGGQVKVSIDAPKEITIDREEIHLAKMKDAQAKSDE